MKNFVLNEILLLSHLDRRAKKVKFDPKTTIILGVNDTGKSCLLKSIYRTFGAEPAKTHPRWTKSDVLSLIRFTLDAQQFSMLQHNRLYAIFDDKDQLIKNFTRVTSELGPFLARLFDFKVKLNDKSGNAVIPPPAYFFLPFYIDQDSSWNRNWSSFAKLQQFREWRQSIAEYHTGMKPNKFYELKADLDRLTREIKEATAELRVLESAKARIKEQFPPGTFDVDIDSFRSEVEELISRCQELNKVEETFKEKLIDLRNHKMLIGYQITIANQAVKEKGADYKFATSIVEDHLDCPTCGAIYENSFAERFAIAQDEDRCRDLVVSLKQDEIDLNYQIEKLREQYAENREQFVAVSRILEKRQSDIRLKDVIESEGKKEVDRVFSAHLLHYQGEVFKSEMELNQVKDSLKFIETQLRTKKKEISSFYLSFMRSYLNKLQVLTLPQGSYNQIYSNIKEIGSDLPRALLAYYYSVLQTMKKYSSSAFCPIVIDSPNQQGQDPASLRKMIEFILESKPEDSQLILGLENLNGLKPDVKIIELKTKLQLLRKEEYKKVSREVSPLLEQLSVVL